MLTACTLSTSQSSTTLSSIHLTCLSLRRAPSLRKITSNSLRAGQMFRLQAHSSSTRTACSMEHLASSCSSGCVASSRDSSSTSGAGFLTVWAKRLNSSTALNMSLWASMLDALRQSPRTVCTAAPPTAAPTPPTAAPTPPTAAPTPPAAATAWPAAIWTAPLTAERAVPTAVRTPPVSPDTRRWKNSLDGSCAVYGAPPVA
mmetsp:Transcript_27051/g.80223  ORF Transcript_27051/g.80223 Transcript_27051/m.80223 type:complete len:202 (+) Transcript_27051:332-937(+)